MRVCLSMIVKNESRIIERMLQSVVGFADEYCICDTGSTDNTIELIEAFPHLKGRVYSDPFVNFEVSRTNALHEAQKSGADYILLMDADMLLQGAATFDKSKLTLGAYTLDQESGNGLKYGNMRLVRGDAPVRYVGVTHEYVDTGHLSIGEIHDDLWILDVGDGGCKSDKFERDIRLLQQGLKDEPNNVRYRFYLANSYFDTQQYEDAVIHYALRVMQEGWAEEVYYSLYRISLCYKGLNKEDEFLKFAMKAWNFRPTRAESIFEAMQYYHEKQNHKMVVALYQLVKNLPVSKDKLFVSTRVYSYQMHNTYSLSAFFAGETSPSCYTILFNSPHGDHHNQFGNYRFYYPVPSGVAVDLSCKHLLNGELFVGSSPSIVAVGSNQYTVNVRLVNYTINAQGGYECTGNAITTHQKMLLVDSSFKQQGDAYFPSTEFEERKPDAWSKPMRGVEDLKLANVGGKVMFTGTVCLKSGRIGTCLGVYDQNKLVPRELEPLQQCEKNWLFVQGASELTMVYKWHPLMYGTVQNDTLVLKPSKPMPRLFESARGSANGVEYNNHYWFVVHFVYAQTNERRVYYHGLVVLDKEMNLKRYTLPFKFTKQPTEYCAGVVVEKERVVLTHSVLDKEAYARIYGHDAFEWIDHS